MGIRLTVLSELFHDGSEQEIIVRDHLSVQQLVTEIVKEYQLPQAHYRLRIQDSNTILKSEQSLEQAGIQTGAVLIFEVDDGSRRSAHDASARAFLIAPSGTTFELQRNPALIGRPNAKERLTSGMLDADLTQIDVTKSSSRPHAQIIKRDGLYHLESLRYDNPAFVNGVPVATGISQPLHDGDTLRFGNVTLFFSLKGHRG